MMIRNKYIYIFFLKKKREREKGKDLIEDPVYLYTLKAHSKYIYTGIISISKEGPRNSKEFYFILHLLFPKRKVNRNIMLI
jgi:hypothetical protein